MLNTRTITTIGAITVALAAPAGATAQQDLRSPDARDAAGGVVRSDSGQDLRSPDARDAARPIARPSMPAPPVERPSVSDGFEWGHAGIGGAAVLAVVLALGGGVLLVGRRRVSTPITR